MPAMEVHPESHSEGDCKSIGEFQDLTFKTLAKDLTRLNKLLRKEPTL